MLASSSTMRCVSSPLHAPSPQLPPPWFLTLLAAYAVLELSFNHQLMQASSAALVDPDSLRDLEFWARVISGLGLSPQPLLSPFVEWSLRTQPAWQEPTRWLHETLLVNYAFRRPPLLADIRL